MAAGQFATLRVYSCWPHPRFTCPIREITRDRHSCAGWERHNINPGTGQGQMNSDFWNNCKWERGMLFVVTAACFTSYACLITYTHFYQHQLGGDNYKSPKRRDL